MRPNEVRITLSTFMLFYGFTAILLILMVRRTIRTNGNFYSSRTTDCSDGREPVTIYLFDDDATLRFHKLAKSRVRTSVTSLRIADRFSAAIQGLEDWRIGGLEKGKAGPQGALREREPCCSKHSAQGVRKAEGMSVQLFGYGADAISLGC